MLKSFVKFAAAPAFAIAPRRAAAQIQTVDPSQPASWQSAPAPTSDPVPEAEQTSPEAQPSISNYTPTEPQTGRHPESVPPARDNRELATRTTEQANTVPRRD